MELFTSKLIVWEFLWEGGSVEIYVSTFRASILIGKLLIDSINDLFLSKEVIFMLFLLYWGNPKALTSVVKSDDTSITSELSSGLIALISKEDKIGSKFEFFTDS